MVKKKEKKNKEFSCVPIKRVYLLVFFLFILFFLVVSRLYELQCVQYEKFLKIANSQHKIKKKIQARRGRILIQDGDSLFPVAVDREMKLVYLNPKEIKEDPEFLALKLSDILKIDKELILEKINKKDDSYELLKRKLLDEEAIAIESLNQDGVYLSGEDWRYYPSASLAAQTIGFVGYHGDSLDGRYGIEKQFEAELKGVDGELEQERDTVGSWISLGKKSHRPAKDGNDLVLTLDYSIQFKAESILKNAVKKHEADGGKIIIMNPQNGKILAMAIEPSYNLNEYSKVEDIQVFMNSIISHEYECGSVFKPFTMAMGLDMGKVQPDSVYFDNGAVREAGYVIRNSDEKSYGEQTMTNVIERSLNTGVIFVERLVGNQSFLIYTKNFGFGRKTGISFPGESFGNIKNLESDRDIEYYTASFGQGLTVTPLQLVLAYSSLANGGELLKPILVEKILDSRNKKERLFSKTLLKNVISKDTSNKITMMLESNVKNGHGKLAGVPGFRIAGKTGTAQIADKEKGGYLEDATVGTFAGYGPVENPVFAMVVIIDYPKDVEWAESTAAPVFGELSQFILNHYGIKASEDYEAKDLKEFASKHNYLNQSMDDKSDNEKDFKDE